MNALVRGQFYFMTLFVAVLLTVGRAASDNRTESSTRGTEQMVKKPTIMILGSHHLAGWDGDNIDDMRAPKRQRELQQFVEQLIGFKLTKIAVEADTRWDAKLQTEYNAYLKDDFQLERHEIHQVGFRLAKQMGHSKVHCVDYFWTERSPRLPESEIDWDSKDYRTFAKAHNQEHLLRPPSIEPEKYEPIIDMYIRLNQPEWSRADHQKYLRSARIGLEDQYPGANWVAHTWYARNLKICINLTRITESTDERILLIIGAGHIFLIQQFFEDSGDCIVESPLDYLSSEETQ